jgi:hypothetical protein
VPSFTWVLVFLAVILVADIVIDIRRGFVADFSKLPVKRTTAPFGFWATMFFKLLFVMLCIYWIGLIAL